METWHRVLPLFAISMTLLLYGCGNSGQSQSCDTQGCTISEPLAVISTEPTSGQINVPLSQCPYSNQFCRGIVKITFNQSVNIDTMDFQIAPFLQGTLHCPQPDIGPGVVGCRVSPPTTVPPDQAPAVWYDGYTAFLPNTTYTATIVSATSSDGKPLGTYSWSFTTAAQ
jgi:hypothetical protein